MYEACTAKDHVDSEYYVSYVETDRKGDDFIGNEQKFTHSLIHKHTDRQH